MKFIHESSRVALIRVPSYFYNQYFCWSDSYCGVRTTPQCQLLCGGGVVSYHGADIIFFSLKGTVSRGDYWVKWDMRTNVSGLSAVQCVALQWKKMWDALNPHVNIRWMLVNIKKIIICYYKLQNAFIFIFILFILKDPQVLSKLSATNYKRTNCRQVCALLY